jgi:hypothetical protein
MRDALMRGGLTPVCGIDAALSPDHFILFFSLSRLQNIKR